MAHETRNARFSWITGGNTPITAHPWDVEVAGNAQFAVIPSMGSLVPGWLLALPRAPKLNLSGLIEEHRSSLSKVIDQVEAKLEGLPGEVYCFEHGSMYNGSLAGCGVDHAHLHIVPLEFDLIAAAKIHDDVEWSDLDAKNDPLTQLPKDGEYIVIWRRSDGAGLVGKPQKPTSQWVRRVIANSLGASEEWNYRTHPQHQNVQSTLTALKVQEI